MIINLNRNPTYYIVERRKNGSYYVVICESVVGLNMIFKNFNGARLITEIKIRSTLKFPQYEFNSKNECSVNINLLHTPYFCMRYFKYLMPNTVMIDKKLNSKLTYRDKEFIAESYFNVFSK